MLWKIHIKVGTMPYYGSNGWTMTLKWLLGLFMISKKNFQLFFSSPCYLQKINKNFYPAKNHDFWFLEGKNLPLAYSNSMWLKIHLILETSNMVGPLFTDKNHFWLILVLTKCKKMCFLQYWRENRSPKGNMWSAIPVALLYTIMNWRERKQGSGPEGDKVL